MKKEKVVVYTVIIGDCDKLIEIDKSFFEKKIDYMCFTNNKNIMSDTWKIVYIEDQSLSNHLLSRKIKMLGHPLLKNYDILVYIDGSVEIKDKISQFLKKECELDKYPLVVFKHSIRKSVYEEANACVEYKKDNKEIIKKQLAFYKKEKFPDNLGLYELGTFVRRQNDLKVRETMELWYAMINKYSRRDQLSFPYAIYKTGLQVKALEYSVWNNPYTKMHSHYREEKKIINYRLYFGDSKEFLLECVEDGTYQKVDDSYSVSSVVPVNTNRIEWFLNDMTGVKISNLEIKTNRKYQIEIQNYTVIDGEKYFFNNGGKIVILGDFKKNDFISMSINLNILSLEDWISIAYQMEQKVYELEKGIGEFEQRIGELEQDLGVKNSENEKLNEELNKVLTSKAWVTIEKLRKIKGRFK